MPTPRFVLALKSIIDRKHASVVELPMPSCSATSAIISDIQHTYNELKTSVMYIVKEYIISNKSQSEIFFLTSILLAVLLFAIILPTYEALFGSEYENEYDVDDDDQYNIISSSGRSRNTSRIIENKEVSSPKPLRRTSNLMYKPGVGVVEVIYEEPPLLRLSSDGSNSACSSSDQSFTGSICSHFSLETIEEEYLQDEDTNDNNLTPQLDTTIEEEDEDQLLGKEEPKEPDDYVKYYEYLVLQGLSLQGS